MARGRSKSVVQKIASKAPAYSTEDLKLENESTDAKSIRNPTLPPKQDHVPSYDRRRAKSLSWGAQAKSEHKAKIEVHVSTPMFPFTEPEREELLLNFMDSLNYNSVLDSNFIADINDCYDDQIFSFQSDCNLNIAYFESLIEESRAIMANLNLLTSSYDKVVKDTEEFATQSTLLLNRQEELEGKALEMDHVIKMFEPLDAISRSLVSAGNSTIRTGKIKSILLNLQVYLDFLESHRSYKDAEVYAVRYRQCMTRGLTLVRNYLIDYLKTRGAESSARLKEKDVSTLSADIIMYSEFTNELENQTENTKFPILVGAIVDKCTGHKEYTGLVSDVLQQYFKIRLTLIQSNWQQDPKKSSQLNQQVPDTVLYCQKSISTYKKLLEREYGLFVKYFPFQQYHPQFQTLFFDQLQAFFKQVLEPLYDDVRDKILRETSVSELCQLTNVLTSYFEYDEESSVTTSGPDGNIEYGELFEPMLNDSQGRLIFRIENYIDNKLLKYKPKPEDLLLGNRKKVSETGNGPRRASAVDEFEDNLFPELYTPVGKALTILSTIYELVNSMVFDDIAHNIVHSCIYMLKNGAVKLAVAHFGPTDAKLFYLKNLIILKNQLNNFDIQFVRTETSLDFTGGIQELIQIFRSGELYVKFNEKGGLLELVKKSVPKVINDMIDAKREIELELTNSVNEFVTECTNSVCAPILGGEGTLKENNIKLSDNILMKLPHIYSQIKLFIEEEEIIGYLVNMLSKLIFSTYETYYRSIEDKLAALKVSAEELDTVMEPDAFFNFLNETLSGALESDEYDGEINFNRDVLKDLEAAALESESSDEDPLAK